MDANKMSNYAMKDRRKGIVYPKGTFDINDAILVSIHDAKEYQMEQLVGIGPSQVEWHLPHRTL